MGTTKKRLDEALVNRGLAPTREKAKAHILAGEVWSGEKRLEKAGQLVSPDSPIEIRSKRSIFASRGGEKLEHALAHFGVCPKDRFCIDIGASTGGFTDCLLKHGARSVLAVDVGKGQLDIHLRQHPQVIVLEETNARELTLSQMEKLMPEARLFSLVVMDVSFISLQKIIESLSHELSFVQDWVLLFKPQFEVGPKNLAKGGVVKNPQATKTALHNFHLFMEKAGFQRPLEPEISPIVGKKSGNVEYLLHYVRNRP